MATANTLQTERIKQALAKGVGIDEAKLAMEEDTEYLYDKMFPIVPVTQPAGTATVLDVDTNFGEVNDIITPESVPNRIGATYKEVTFSVQNYALRYLVTDEAVNLHGSATVLTQQGTRAITNALRCNMETRFIDKFFGTNTPWKTKIKGAATSDITTTGTTQYWNDTASSPLKDIRAAREKNVGWAGNLKMNRAIVSYDVWNALIEHPDVYEKLIGDSNAPKTEMALQQALAVLLGVERLDVIEHTVALGSDKVVIPDTNTETVTPNNVRKMKGYFALYRHENAKTLFTKAAGVVINYTKGLTTFNGGVPEFEAYRCADKGQKATWIDGRISGGLLITNPAGLIEFTGLIG